jgi:hypothetical protein
MIWIEAKFWESFNRLQIDRTRNIAALCSSELFAPYFQKEQVIVLLGQQDRHKKAQKIDGTRFLAWEDCFKIAEKILPQGKNNYTTKSFDKMLSMKRNMAEYF